MRRLLQWIVVDLIGLKARASHLGQFTSCYRSNGSRRIDHITGPDYKVWAVIGPHRVIWLSRERDKSITDEQKKSVADEWRSTRPLGSTEQHRAGRKKEGPCPRLHLENAESGGTHSESNGRATSVKHGSVCVADDRL